MSSIMLGRLLDGLRGDARVRRSERAALLGRLGYVRHPALEPTGQVHNDVLPDGGKPQLFILPAAVDPALTKPAEVAAAYARAQGVPTSATAPAPFART